VVVAIFLGGVCHQRCFVVSDPGRRCRIFIGDVHGCADELEDLLECLDFRPDRHELWFAGDLANRGPHALRALRRVREVATGVVLGNHDLHLLGVAAGDRELREADTIAPILSAPDCEELLAWLRRQPLLVEWDDVVLVHAGLHPRWHDPGKVAASLQREVARGQIPWKDEDLAFLTRARECDATGRRPEGDDVAGDWQPWHSFYAGTRTVVWGHWAAFGLVNLPRLRGLDSGCVWGGALSAWRVDEDEIVSVPARRVYLRPE
jgi:bis(5'-nucleosyl)-tetraphosphatase (symmetrical)